MMLSDVPNFAFAIGLHERLLDAQGRPDQRVRLPAAQPHGRARLRGRSCRSSDDPSVTEEPFLDFAAGYVLRSVDQFPRQGSKAPWRLRMNYALDIRTLRYGPIEDGALSFSSPAARPQAPAPVSA